MKRKIKNCLALVMTLILALALAVPVLAAETDGDGYTVVTTAYELVEALTNGTTFIKMGNNISTVNSELSAQYSINHDLTLDLGGYAWTSTETIMINSDADDGNTPTVTICNGSILVGNGNRTVIQQEAGNLKLQDLTINGKYSLSGTSVASIENCQISRIAEPAYLNGDASAIQFAMDSNAEITQIKNSTIIGYYLGINMGSGSIGSIEGSTITGMMGNGISMKTMDDQTVSPQIGQITGSSITSQKDGEYGIEGGGGVAGEIGSIILYGGQTISGIYGVNIVGSTSEVLGGTGQVAGIDLQRDGSKIDAISNCKIAGIFIVSGEIGIIEGCTIDHVPEGNEYTAAISIGSTNASYSASGSIGTIRDCIITVDKTNKHGIALLDGEIGMIAGSTITATSAGIVNYGTIDRVEDNTITATEYGVWNKSIINSISGNSVTSDSYAVLNTSGTILDLGEENKLTGKTTWGAQQADVLNDGGKIHITATGTLSQVEASFGDDSFETTAFSAVDGWQAINTGYEGTEMTVPENYSLRFVGQIRLIEPWGLRINVAALNNGTAVEQSAVRSVRIGFVQGTGGYQWITAAQNGNYYSADFTGIQTQYLNTPIRFAAEVTLTDGTVIESGDKTVNLLELLKSSASSSANSAKERAVYQAIVNWFNAYQSYLGK